MIQAGDTEIVIGMLERGVQIDAPDGMGVSMHTRIRARTARHTHAKAALLVSGDTDPSGSEVW